MSKRRILTTLAAVFLGLTALFSAFGQEEDPRITHARAEVSEARKLLAGVTNEIEIASAQDRLIRAESALSNLVSLVSLKEQEHTFVLERKSTSESTLREALAAIDTSTNDFLSVVMAKNEEIRRLKTLRADFVQRLREAPNDSERQAKVQHIDSELLARTLERDLAELQLRLAREADRIDREYRALDLNPRPTVKLIHHKRQNTVSAEHRRDEFSLLRDQLKAEYEETGVALELAKQQQELLAKEIVNLQDLRERARKNKNDAKRSEVDNHLNRANKQKDYLTERLRHIPAQHNAYDQALKLLNEGINLFDAEASFLRDDRARLTTRYFRRITFPLFLVAVVIIGYGLLSRLVFPIIFKRDSLFVARRMGGYLTALLVLFLLISFFLEDLKAIATVMGIVGAAVVIALQDLCSSFAGWFVIVASRKVKVGDRVEIDGHRGDIIDIQMLRTTMMELSNWLGVDEPTGRIVIVPNSFIFKHQVFNYSHVHPFIWGTVDVTVTFETPPEEARELLQKILEEETKEEFEGAERGGHHLIEEYGLIRVAYEPHIHTVIADSGVTYSLFYVTHYRRFSATRDKISARILKEFEKNPRMDFAYPTERHIPTPPETKKG